jgi:small basic protein
MAMLGGSLGGCIHVGKIIKNGRRVFENLTEIRHIEREKLQRDKLF